MKPYVILNAAMTLDGKIATKTGSSEISNEKDLIRVHELRKEVDGIIVGINTVILDDPRLTAHKIESTKKDNPIRIIVDSKGKTPIASRILKPDAETIIAVANNFKDELIVTDRWEILKKGANFYFNGEKQVDLNDLMEYLYSKGIEKIMLEGGSTLNYSMIKEGLIDEIRICIAPMIAGGIDSISLFGGEGIENMKNAFKLKLNKSYNLDEDLILHYKVIKK
ncbi:MAG: 2,5-diamino-6-(ribosylamino)-4(3H)-pyrimidinone 5'-phosphate reductase [Methanobacteriaceae archaeon]|jgi:2,5-diamino-6-(ribosylamino)-4(3H)-pyrimidinone 5'-phosphate reductase|nr:2,5-diamino-6-(ribosylamino)-4(3H)-pyrimidinone 5'-phosphate reductase [Methanobacteriaceae archaeon]